MFSFPPKPERRASFEGIFFEHSPRLLEWALQLTRGDRSDAEDLVQDLYVRFARLDTTPEHVENAENYLFSALRNLHYTRAKRARTNAVDDLSIVDYDSVQRGLRAVDRSELLPSGLISTASATTFLVVSRHPGQQASSFFATSSGTFRMK